ncbi:DsbA family protein [Herbiconiux sp. CPCC 205763]|uniref:DsbA family protein n=1 Tax=Herbiconiux aconitum TaxID=2970913 RepID=A0ABT2GLI1_9MICO|nr:DsbA family protein [Herbiconiux aconitum]MCS5717082.1 DsbA family protein [Herbiconiux aconitum]
MSPAKSDKSMYDGLAKKDRQALAREIARIQREEERRRKKRNRVILITSLSVVVALALAGTGLAVYNGIRATFVGPLNMLSDGIIFTGDPANASAAEGATPAPPVATKTAAIQPDAQPVASDLDTATVLRVTEYVDYSSPDVAKFETANGSALQSYVSAGYASIELHPVALEGAGSSDSYATRAANTIACVANTTPDAALVVHNALVAAQPTLPDGGLTNDALVALVQKAGATDPAIATCITGNEFDDWVGNATARAQKSIPNSDVTTLTTVPLVVIDGTAYTGALDDTEALNTFITDVFTKASAAAGEDGAGTEGSGATETPAPTPAPTPDGPAE